MSILNYPWNLTGLMSNSTSTTLPGQLTCTIAINLPWWFSGLSVIFALALWIVFADDPGKEKFLYITFLTMLLSWLLRMFTCAQITLVNVSVPTMWTGAFIAVAVWYFITRDRA